METKRGYYPDGSIQYKHRYDHGDRHGIWRGWYPDGTLRYENRYDHGERVEAR